mmetsp:Transcript_45963/g.103289  ORF Transcript_45963/g.103289 Transcript_45963/m.103289 type:complete len:220 (-) Transcript_45963:58-717(-)
MEHLGNAATVQHLPRQWLRYGRWCRLRLRLRLRHLREEGVLCAVGGQDWRHPSHDLPIRHREDRCQQCEALLLRGREPLRRPRQGVRNRQRGGGEHEGGPREGSGDFQGDHVVRAARGASLQGDGGELVRRSPWRQAHALCLRPSGEVRQQPRGHRGHRLPCGEQEAPMGVLPDRLCEVAHRGCHGGEEEEGRVDASVLRACWPRPRAASSSRERGRLL